MHCAMCRDMHCLHCKQLRRMCETLIASAGGERKPSPTVNPAPTTAGLLAAPSGTAMAELETAAWEA